MEFTIQVIRASDFVRVTPSGDLDFKALHDAFRAALAQSALPDHLDFLIDCRGAVIHMTLADITSLVALMAGHRSLFDGKLAFLPPDDAGYKLVKFLEIYAAERGFLVAVFEEYEGAVNWLMLP